MKKTLVDSYIKIVIPRLPTVDPERKVKMLRGFEDDIIASLEPTFGKVECLVEEEHEYSCPYCGYIYSSMSEKRNCCDEMIYYSQDFDDFIVAFSQPEATRPVRVLTIFDNLSQAEKMVKELGGHPVFLISGRDAKSYLQQPEYVVRCGKCDRFLTNRELTEGHKYNSSAAHERCCSECGGE